MPFFLELNALFSTKNSKKTYCLRGFSVINALNFKKWVVKIQNCALLLDFFVLFALYCTYALIFYNKPCFSIKQYRIITQNPAEDICDRQSMNFWYRFPILTENTDKTSI